MAESEVVVTVATGVRVGAGAGLVVNELSVWLAFDIFYRDVFTRDPNVPFDPGLLYRRSESFWLYSSVPTLSV